MKIIMLVLLFLPMVVLANQTTFNDFKECYSKNSKKVTDAGERAFLDSYLHYLDTGRESDGKAAIKRLSELKPKDKTRINSRWIGIFEGPIELCCAGADSACSYSFGSASLEKLMPRLKKGDRTAINLVLTYSALVETDGAESQSLGEYQKVIRKNQKAVDAYLKKNKAFLEDYSINWLVD